MNAVLRVWTRFELALEAFVKIDRHVARPDYSEMWMHELRNRVV